MINGRHRIKRKCSCGREMINWKTEKIHREKGHYIIETETKGLEMKPIAVAVIAIAASIIIASNPSVAEGVNILYNTVSINLLDYNVTTLKVNDYIWFAKAGMENCTIKTENGTTYCGTDLTGGGTGGGHLGKAPWMYNDTTYMYFNETKFNASTGQYANASRQSADNTTLGNKVTTLQADNTTQKNAIDNEVTLQAANNNTQTTLITGNNNTLTNTKAGTGACGTGFVVQNTTTSGVQCVSAAGGSGDNAGADNQTLTDKITGNNNTLVALLGGKVNLSNSSIDCTAGNYLRNVTVENGRIKNAVCAADVSGGGGNATASGIAGFFGYFYNATHIITNGLSRNGSTLNVLYTYMNTTATVMIQGINVTGRQISDNTTIQGNLTAIGTRIGTLETKESSDNSTQATLITGNNQTLTNLKFNNTGGTITGNVIIASKNLTIYENYTICLNAPCTAYITKLWNETIIQG